MVETNKLNNNDGRLSKDKYIAAMEARRITSILENHFLGIDCGSVINKEANKLLEPKQYKMISCEWNHQQCCNAYQIHWNIAHLSTGNNFLSFVTSYFKHNFIVVKFHNKADNHDDMEFMRQFKMDKGKWGIVEYGGLICEYCESYVCDCVQYREELDSIIKYVTLLDIKSY